MTGGEEYGVSGRYETCIGIDVRGADHRRGKPVTLYLPQRRADDVNTVFNTEVLRSAAA